MQKIAQQDAKYLSIMHIVSCQIVQHIAYSVMCVQWDPIMQFSIDRRWKRGTCREASSNLPAVCYDIFLNHDSISSRGPK